jgi:hypothetical protein
MRLSTKRWASGDDVRKVVLAALATALDDRKEEAKKKPGLTGVREVAGGASVGIGMGQVNRVDAARLELRVARDHPDLLVPVRFPCVPALDVVLRPAHLLVPDRGRRGLPWVAAARAGAIAFST